MSKTREQRRQEILDAASALIHEGGIEAVTFGHLEKRLPFTRGVITYNFANRDAILDATLDAALTTLAPKRASKVDAALRDWVTMLTADPVSTSVLLAFWQRAASDPRGPILRERLIDAWVSSAARADGVSKEQARLVVALVLGLVLQQRIDPSMDIEREVRLAGDLFKTAPDNPRLLKRAMGVFRGR